MLNIFLPKKHPTCLDSTLDFNKDRPTQAHVAELKEVCNACPVREDCLEWALTEREPLGVWGGMTSAERSVLV